MTNNVVSNENLNKQPEAREAAWIIQSCVNAFENIYENWPGYSEHLMTRPEMINALDECLKKWPKKEFRGHNALNAQRRSGEANFYV